MNKTLKAKQEFFYGGKTHKEGDEFTASDPDANILCVLGKAEEVSVRKEPPEQVFEAPKLQTADLKAEEDQQKTETNSPRRRQYRRRDMTAED